MARYARFGFSFVIVGLLVFGPWVYARARQARLRNFHEVQAGVLYRSGQMSLGGFQRVLHDHGIKTVVTLRDAARPGEPPPDLVEEELCKKLEINHFRIPSRAWEPAADGSVPAEHGLKAFQEVMKDRNNYPVLIHCFAGIHRTGAYCAVYRMEFDRWSNTQAIQELMSHGYYNISDEVDLLGYLETYVPTWKR